MFFGYKRKLAGCSMAISFTDKFGLDKKTFQSTGAFDTILNVDSRFFIDPALLEGCTIPEFTGAKAKVEAYFSGIVTLLSLSKDESDGYWKKADKLLKFRELSGTCLGYSKTGTSGNAIGSILRLNILRNIKELIVAGETSPVLFELLGVFQEDIGCDRISDLITFILTEEIKEYTHRIVEAFGIQNHSIAYKNNKYSACLNPYNGKPILLIPSSILSPLIVAESYMDIDLICFENERVRNVINSYLDLSGRKKKLSKSQIYKLMKNIPLFRETLIEAYKNTPYAPYDFHDDPIGEYAWYRIAKEYAQDYPLHLKLPVSPTVSDIYAIAESICIHYKTLVEDNGLWSLFYNDDTKKPKHERAAQLLFYGIADAYCTANDIDISREPNSGRGSVDFKLSRGAKEKVIVEIKLTSNNRLRHGFTEQVPIYMRQEKTRKAIYLIVDNGFPKALSTFRDIYNAQENDVREKIICIIVDATRPKSASTA